MLTIAICDDDVEMRRKVKENICLLLGKMKLEDSQLYTYASAAELLDAYPQGLDLLLMDIQMPGLTGIEAAREIRTFDPDVTLIFMTNFAQYAVEGYQVQAYNYLLKPISRETFFREIGQVLTRLTARSEKRIAVRSEGSLYMLAQKEILFAETAGKNVLLHTLHQTYTMTHNMKMLEKQLPEADFFRIHTAYTVHMAAITSIEKEVVTLRGGTTLPISRHRKKAFMAAYMSYMGGML